MTLVRSVERAAELLQCLADWPHGASVADLVAAMRVERTAVWRLLATLERAQLVRRLPDRKWALGPGLITLGEAARSMLTVSEVARDALRELMRATGEPAYLTIRQGNEALCVDCVESIQPFRVAYHVGMRHRLKQAAPGHVLAAFADVEAPEDRALLLIRQRGWAESRDELQVGAMGISAPVFDHSRRVVAALGIVGPTVRIQLHQELFRQQVVRAAQTVSEALGYRPRTTDRSKQEGGRVHAHRRVFGAGSLPERASERA